MANWWDEAPLHPDAQQATATPPAENWWSGAALAPPQSGTSLADVGRMAMTAGVRGTTGLVDALSDPLAPLRRLISPSLERIEQSGSVHPGQAAGNAIFSTTGVPEYQPTTPVGRTAMAGAQGLVSGAPFGLMGAGIGVASGLLGQGTQEATSGVLSPENSERAGIAAGLVPSGAVALARMRPQRAEIPTTQELRDAGAAGFDAFRQSGVDVDAAPIATMAQRVQNDLSRDGFRRSFATDTFDILDELASPPNVPGGRSLYEPADLHTVRRQLQEVINRNIGGANPNRTEVAAASRTLRELDGFIENLGQNPQNLAYGTPQQATEAADTFREARGNYASAMRSNDLTGNLDRANTGILERAEARAQATNSGRNLDNAIRQRIASLLERPREVAGYSPEELDALNAALQGGPVRNTARVVGNVLGGGGGLGQAVMGGMGAALGASGGPISAAIGAAAPMVGGVLAKALQNALARRSLGQADQTVRMNSPLYEDRLTQLPPRDAAILRALIPGLLASQRSQ